MRISMKSVLRTVLTGVCLTTLGAAELVAIPAFARKYATSCSTCHVAMPKLNAYGDAFRRNGYVLPVADKAFVKEKPVLLGAKAWEELWPKAIWPGEIQGSVPLSAYMHQRAVAQFSKDPTRDTVFFDAPHELELLTGGNLGEKVGFFGEWVLFENETNAVGLKRLFIQFNDMFTKLARLPQNAVNIRIGRVEPTTAGGYPDATRRLTMEHPITIDLRALENSGIAGWDAGYRWRMRDPQSGIELTGVPWHHLEYGVGIVNGQSFTLSEGRGGNPNAKDYYGRLSFKIGGLGFDGYGVGQGLNETENWRDDSFTIGTYFYKGRTLKSGTIVSPTTENRFDRAGVDLRWQWYGLDILGGYIQGTDELDNTIRTDDVESRAWFIEPNYRFYPWLIGLVRFEEFKIECDTGGFDPARRACTGAGRGTLKEGMRINPHLLALIRPNIRFGLEYLYEDRDWWRGARPAPGTDDAKPSKWVKANIQLVF